MLLYIKTIIFSTKILNYSFIIAIWPYCLILQFIKQLNIIFLFKIEIINKK